MYIIECLRQMGGKNKGHKMTRRASIGLRNVVGQDQQLMLWMFLILANKMSIRARLMELPEVLNATRLTHLMRICVLHLLKLLTTAGTTS